MKNEKPHEYTCMRCKQPKVSHTGVRGQCPDCVKMSMRRLTDEQYLQWLALASARIEGGLPLQFWDDTTPGDKDTYCSWGMCNDDLNAWPWQDTWDHPKYTKPTGDPGKKQVQHVSRGPAHWCPFDRGAEENKGEADSGCFYRCAIFQSRGAQNLPSREDAVARCKTTSVNFLRYLAHSWTGLDWAERISERVESLDTWLKETSYD